MTCANGVGDRYFTWLTNRVKYLTHPADKLTATDLTAAELREVIARVARAIRRQGGAIGAPIPAGAISALATLDRRGAMTVSELARHEQVTPPLITKITRHLTADGLITKTVDAHDGRVVRLDITSAGQALLSQRRDRGTAWLADRLRSLDDDHRARLESAIPALELLLDDSTRERPEPTR